MRKEKIKIFIIDHEDSFHELLKIKLIQFGYTKIFFSLNYKDAIHQFELIQPDLVIIGIDSTNDCEIKLVNNLLAIKEIPYIFLTNDLPIDSAPAKTISKKDFNDLDLLQNIELALMDSLRENSTLVQSQNNLNTDFIFTKQGANLIRIFYDDILWFQTIGSYVQLLTKNEKKYKINYSLLSLLEVLPKNDFIKVHKNYIVHKKHLRLFNFQENYIMINDSKIEVSLKLKTALLSAINFI